MRRLALLGALGLLLAAITPAGAKNVAFPDGEWSGTPSSSGSVVALDAGNVVAASPLRPASP